MLLLASIMKYILGISAYYHDSAAVLLKDGVVVAAAQEERFTRIRHDAAFPAQAAAWCLQYEGISMAEVDVIAFYDKPFLKFERLLESYYSFAPKGWFSFAKSMPVWIKEKLFMKDMLLKSCKALGSFDRKKTQLAFTEHHLSHAASAYYCSPFEEALILTIDGVGEFATASIAFGKGKDIRILKELQFPHSLGLLYSAFTYYLGFKVNSGEYKMMGLSPYGNHGSDNVKRYKDIICSKLMTVYEDGSLWLNQEYFNYSVGLKMARDSKWESLFNVKKRGAEDELTQAHCDLAMAVQEITEEVVLKMAKHAKALHPSENLCMAGGVALNCVANGRLWKSGLFKDIFIQPAAGDAGGALGAALSAYYTQGQVLRNVSKEAFSPYLGPGYQDAEIEAMMKQYSAVANYIEADEMLFAQVSRLINEGNVVGWFRGKMEWGPRALGHRSIIADPGNEEMQKKLNLKIKYRESFRPFAPMVLEEDMSQFFDLDIASPYMLMVAPVKEVLCLKRPEGYEQFSLKDKLYSKRSTLPAITHVDYSARIQTVSKENDADLHALLQSFKSLSGYGMLVNTSFNVRGEPIVRTPEDAYRCFMRTEMDVLVMENFIFLKAEQPAWMEKTDWRDSILPD